MVEDLVNYRASLFLGVGPVAGRHVVFLLFERVLPVLIVSRNLSCAPRRESNFDLRGRQTAFSYEQLAMALLLGGDVLFGIDIAVRIGVRAGCTMDWSRVVRGWEEGSV
jgi:hypothetical protein